MAYDEGLAERIRGLTGDEPGVSEKRMFGGIAFLLHGNMFCGVSNKGDLMVRLGPAGNEAALKRPGARPMDFTGKPMAGFLFVSPDGIAEDAALAGWVEDSLQFVRGLPPKKG